MHEILLVYNPDHSDGPLPIMESFLKSVSRGYTLARRDRLDFSVYAGKKLVLVLGGDGTFLRASHFNMDVPMYGVNPNPDTKEGFYMNADIRNFKERLNRIFSGGFRELRYLRLAAALGSKDLPELILNEIYIGDAKPYAVFNYELAAGGRKEFQRSSGILVATPSGSTAWIRSAGGIVQDIEERKFQFAARELYVGKHTKDYRLGSGIMKEDEELVIDLKSAGIAVIDSLSEEYAFSAGEIIKIKASGHDLRTLIPV